MPIVRVVSFVPRLTLHKPLFPLSCPMVGQTFLSVSLYLELRLLNEIPPQFLIRASEPCLKLTPRWY
jgi:hypothetical protein